MGLTLCKPLGNIETHNFSVLLSAQNKDPYSCSNELCTKNVRKFDFSIKLIYSQFINWLINCWIGNWTQNVQNQMNYTFYIEYLQNILRTIFYFKENSKRKECFYSSEIVLNGTFLHQIFSTLSENTLNTLYPYQQPQCFRQRASCGPVSVPGPGWAASRPGGAGECGGAHHKSKSRSEITVLTRFH